MKLPILLLCAFMLTAGQSQAQSRYRFSSGASEVTDTRTGLVWRRCTEGMVWNGAGCTGTPAAFSHEAALIHAKSQKGWRLPNVKELASIVDRSRMTPAIDPAAFPVTPSAWYWSSSPYAGDSNFAWVVGFQYGVVAAANRNGTVQNGTKVDYVGVRLVR